MIAGTDGPTTRLPKTAAEAILLAGIRERLRDHWRVRDYGLWDDDCGEVDVEATNRSLNDGHSGTYTPPPPGDARIPRVETVIANTTPISPNRLVIVLLCGGLATRSAGTVNPLVRVFDPVSRQSQSLIRLQIRRLQQSPLRNARLMLFASPLNAAALRRELATQEGNGKIRIYTGGLVPRLALYQQQGRPPRLHRGADHRLSYNPAGHLDALRWLVIEGLLDGCDDNDVVLILSYSNWAPSLFDATALFLAEYARDITRKQAHRLFLAEVSAAPASKRTGSLLISNDSNPYDMRLVKPPYRWSGISTAIGAEVLMSTNTLYFPVAALKTHLLAAETVTSKRPPITHKPTARAIAAALFDNAFDINPYLSLKRLANGSMAIQAERDLDQLSLLHTRAPLVPIEVGRDRTLSVKHPEQLEHHMARIAQPHDG